MKNKIKMKNKQDTLKFERNLAKQANLTGNVISKKTPLANGLMDLNGNCIFSQRKIG